MSSSENFSKVGPGASLEGFGFRLWALQGSGFRVQCLGSGLYEFATLGASGLPALFWYDPKPQSLKPHRPQGGGRKVGVLLSCFCQGRGGGGAM